MNTFGIRRTHIITHLLRFVKYKFRNCRKCSGSSRLPLGERKGGTRPQATDTQLLLLTVGEPVQLLFRTHAEAERQKRHQSPTCPARRRRPRHTKHNAKKSGDGGQGGHTAHSRGQSTKAPTKLLRCSRELAPKPEAERAASWRAQRVLLSICYSCNFNSIRGTKDAKKLL